MQSMLFKTPSGIALIHLCPFYRLRLPDGGYVFMEYHTYCGPTFYRDRAKNRMIELWWDHPAICAALDWFVKRGCTA